MSWPNDDLKHRVNVAKELDRQSFWKAVYVAAISNLDSKVSAAFVADKALESFDIKFDGKPS